MMKIYDRRGYSFVECKAKNNTYSSRYGMREKAKRVYVCQWEAQFVTK